jgi:uncharacterized protein (TIGR02996 family)
MLDPNEAAFLRSIAENQDDITARLVFSDWLEENDDTPRAEFIRTQCELASAELSPDRRQELRVRERGLLDAHRHEWCQAFGLPVEEVGFWRGLLSGARISQWDGGKMLDPACLPRLATVTELDLSGLQLGDAGLTAFARSAQLPALRKLILSENGITDAGAIALALAAGLPRLDTVYLFQNSINDRARAALNRSPHFRLTNLDCGERAEGYCMSPGEAEMARRVYIRTHLLPVVSRYFNTYERLQSAALCVAQYWADEADDAVHGRLVVSELFEPTLECERYYDDAVGDPNLPNTRMLNKEDGDPGSVINLWGTHWDENTRAIPLWAAFAPEGGHQEYGLLSEANAPAVMFYRHGGYEFLPMCRPHLAGVRPEWGWND